MGGKACHGKKKGEYSNPLRHIHRPESVNWVLATREIPEIHGFRMRVLKSPLESISSAGMAISVSFPFVFLEYGSPFQKSDF